MIFFPNKLQLKSQCNSGIRQRAKETFGEYKQNFSPNVNNMCKQENNALDDIAQKVSAARRNVNKSERQNIANFAAPKSNQRNQNNNIVHFSNEEMDEFMSHQSNCQPNRNKFSDFLKIQNEENTCNKGACESKKSNQHCHDLGYASCDYENDDDTGEENCEEEDEDCDAEYCDENAEYEDYLADLSFAISDKISECENLISNCEGIEAWFDATIELTDRACENIEASRSVSQKKAIYDAQSVIEKIQNESEALEIDTDIDHILNSASEIFDFCEDFKQKKGEFDGSICEEIDQQIEDLLEASLVLEDAIRSVVHFRDLSNETLHDLEVLANEKSIDIQKYKNSTNNIINFSIPEIDNAAINRLKAKFAG